MSCCVSCLVETRRRENVFLSAEAEFCNLGLSAFSFLVEVSVTRIFKGFVTMVTSSGRKRGSEELAVDQILVDLLGECLP